MKLRMRGNTVRLRLTRSEVAQFAQSGLVEETVPFPSAAFQYKVSLAEAISADFVNGTLTVGIPAPLAREWTSTERVGIEAHANGLDILIEKDFQCAHGPADHDAFQPDQLS